MELKGSRTEKNLLAAFAGESQARNRYTYFASQAKKDGFIQISAIFAETADQEKEHAKRFFKYLEGGNVMVEAAFPAGTIGDTAANLEASAGGEHHEWTVLYPESAEIARGEGFVKVAETFEAVSVAEKQHEKRYRSLLENIRQGRVFKREQSVVWACRNCGYVHEGTEPPTVCPACVHPQAHFELLAENW